MANFTEMGSGMPNIFNFIPEAGRSTSGINDLAGLLALSKDEIITMVGEVNGLFGLSLS